MFSFSGGPAFSRGLGISPQEQSCSFCEVDIFVAPDFSGAYNGFACENAQMEA